MTRGEGQVVLITGFPGLVARSLLRQLLEAEPDTEVVLVVLDKLLPQAASEVEALTPADKKRVTVLEGDVASIDLGLSGMEFRELAAAVTRIHHAAYVSYLGADPDHAAYANVQGAAEIVELGLMCKRLECIVHHSTAQVSGDRTGLVLEEELDVGQSFRNPILATRMTAELVMRRAMPDLPIAVVRPTLLVGDSITGETQRLDGPYVLVAMVLSMPRDVAFPLPRDVDNPLDIVPVDYVVKAAHAIGRHRGASGKTFHLTSAEHLNARQVLDLIAQAAGRRTRKSFISANFASALLRTPGLAGVMREPRALLEQLSCGARYDTRNTRAVLGDALVCPPLSSYVGTWVTAVQQQWRAAQESGAAAT